MNFPRVPNMKRGTVMLQDLHKMHRVGRIVPTHHNRQIRFCIRQRIRRRLVFIRSITKSIGRIRKVLLNLPVPETLCRGRLQDAHHLLRFRGQHGGLINHTEKRQIRQRVKPRRRLVPEMRLKISNRPLPGHNICQNLCLFRVQNYHHRRMIRTVRKSSTRLFMRMFSVNHQTISLLSELLPAFPHFFYKRTGRVVLVRVDAFRLQFLLNFERGPKSRHNHNVLFGERVDGNALGAVGIKQKTDPFCQQIFIHGRVVNHFTEKINVAAGMIPHGSVGNVDRVFNPVAETEVPWDEETHWPEVELRG